MDNKSLQIVHPKTKSDFEQVKNLFIEYQQYLGVDLCFQSFDKELDMLDEIYKEPFGTIIIAKYGEEAIGCIALKPIKNTECEMKRLYVKANFRGTGLGKLLAQTIIKCAVERHYTIMKLDTLTTLKEAVALYKSLGFIETSPYIYNPHSEVLYFEKTL